MMSKGMVSVNGMLALLFFFQGDIGLVRSSLGGAIGSEFLNKVVQCFVTPDAPDVPVSHRDCLKAEGAAALSLLAVNMFSGVPEARGAQLVMELIAGSAGGCALLSTLKSWCQSAPVVPAVDVEAVGSPDLESLARLAGPVGGDSAVAPAVSPHEGGAGEEKGRG